MIFPFFPQKHDIIIPVNNIVVVYTYHITNKDEKEERHIKNSEIRDAARIKDVRLWEVAQAAGCTASTLSVWLREDMPDDKKMRFLILIDQIAASRGEK